MAKLLSIRRVSEETSLSKSTIKRMVKAKVFPEPVHVTACRKGWVDDEIGAWNRDRIAARDQRRAPADDPVIVATAKAAAYQPCRQELLARKEEAAPG